ncbi:MAG: dihydroorotate dehydrogenase electron transfer subunit [Candidatus Omnitrophica bacterium]|nr:dihydroorotate dehydrogenase electron transfer subunit [Candidatus Omnitrophota bacterium]
MKQLRAKIVSNKKAGTCFYKMRLASAYLAAGSRPGQFVEIRCARGEDPLLRRPLGVHNIVPGGIEVFYEVVGAGTKLLSAKRAGESLDIIGPLGSGFDIKKGRAANILVAGGIGVAPLVALAGKLSRDKTAAAGMQVLIGAKTKSHVMCEGEFRKYGARVSVSTEDGSRGRKGFITDILKDILGNGLTSGNTAIYSCGPMGMLKAVSRIAREHGIPCQVSLEERMACGVGVCLGCPVKTRDGYKMVCKDGPVFNAEEIAW